MQRTPATIALLVTSAIGCGAPPSPAPAAAEPISAAAPEREEGDRSAASAPPIEREPVLRFARAEEMVGKHVLVAAGTELQLGPAADAPRLQLRTAGAEEPTAFAFAVVDHTAGLLVLTRAEPEARCDPGLPELDPVAPRFYLAPEAVAPVLVRESETRFDDGTWVRLRTGVAIVLDGAQGIADAGGTRVHAAIDPRDIGNAFAPAVAQAPVGTPDTIAGDAELRYGVHRIAGGDDTFYENSVGRRLVLAHSRQGDDELVDLVSGCVSLRARVEPSALSDAGIAAPPPGAAMAALLGSGTGESWSVAAGARASWSDGSPAGTLTAELEFRARSKSRKKLRCFPLGDAASRFEPVELCFAGKDVVHHDPFGMLGMMGSSGVAFSAFGELDEHGGLGALGGSGRIGDSDLGAIGGLGGGMGSFGAGGGGGEIGGLGGLGTTEKGPAIDVRVATLSSSGVRDGKAIRKRLLSRVPTIRRCAERLDPPPSGTLSIAFAIEDAGSTRDVTVTGVDDVADCARAAIDGWSFGPGGAATVTVELELTERPL